MHSLDAPFLQCGDGGVLLALKRPPQTVLPSWDNSHLLLGHCSSHTMALKSLTLFKVWLLFTIERLRGRGGIRLYEWTAFFKWLRKDCTLCGTMEQWEGAVAVLGHQGGSKHMWVKRMMNMWDTELEFEAILDIKSCLLRYRTVFLNLLHQDPPSSFKWQALS